MNESSIKKMKELGEKLREASRAYYQEDREIMSNVEYDALYDTLSALEKETGIVLADSPTVNVGYEAVEQLPKEEHLEIKNHKVYINGKYLEDEGSTMGEEDCVIPDDSIYVMGDNRDHSLDSRKLGTMKISKVVARKVIPEKKL